MNELLTKAAGVKNASIALSVTGEAEKNAALMLIADEIDARANEILAANADDIENGKKSGMNEGLIDRLTLTKERLADIAEGVRQVAGLADPVGEVMEEFTRPNGLKIEKVRVPLGVIGMIYEARPNVTVDSAALALKTGNSILLRGSASALNSNKKLVTVIKDALSKSQLSPDCVELLEAPGHKVVNEMMALTKYLDVLIPRGGASLIQNVVLNSKVPILETGLGNCHIYIDRDADIQMAKKILVNAKTQRPAVCNAAETLLVHSDIAESALPELCKALTDKGVILHGCERARSIVDMLPANEDDYKYEYLKLEMA
ncbi:MAG: glutamate-5-semialdehyde dehydrogenase, partial [Oscillospiraceae bacterium]